MGNKISAIVTTFVMLLSFILMVAFISADSQADESREIIHEFTETARYNGYITYGQYLDLLESIPYSNIKIQMTHFKQDSLGEHSPGTLNMRFTTQILGSRTDNGYDIMLDEHTTINSGTLLYSTGSKEDNNIYKMEVGDQLQVDLFVLEQTFFDAITATVTGEGAPAIKLITSSSGVVLNEKYLKKS